MVIFYQDIAKKRMGRMHLKTDCEFQQMNIKKSNKEFDVDMYSTNWGMEKHLQLNKNSWMEKAAAEK